ncbi:diguanylate cyclase (GGDEF)-like protein [Pararhizobium capsulatum DSM 1112]|uniref:Diguanylate cyclase (GGDEF)-like protein n=2 Tax=Pararhizobium capsulatum TaxID=34014 RepID=A0ABU0BRT2_9HYPH|nr:diguanylate cyclase (GGDEF)-like protein [Pararhizobium capsulatum DSM 1112]
MFKVFPLSSELRNAIVGMVAGALLPTALLYGHGIFGGGSFLSFGATALFSAIVLPLMSGALIFQWSRSRARLVEELERRRETEQQLSRAVHTDQLTGVANRFALERDMNMQSPETDGENGYGALLLLDLDRFKFVNDTMGHDAGDQLLITLSRRLTGTLNGIAGVYRLGGDEFVVLISGAPSEGKVQDIISAVEALFTEPFELDAGKFWTCASIGVALAQDSDGSMTELLKQADLALYKAKEIPGNSHVYYSLEMAQEACRKLEIEHDLSRALAAGEFFLQYQPIVGVESRAVRSFEALIRWHHPQKGIIQPDVFIGAAEKTGMILPIGNWVMRTACQEASHWPSPTGVAVNVAGDQFKDRSFVPYVKQCLADAGLAPGRLTIEVTESIFSVDAAVICESLAELRSHGVRIALDDFGVGFSSINNLRRFPLDQLKVDRSFTRAMLANSRDAELVDIILQLGNTFQVSTTIEGIETEGQMEFVRALGASEAQGFLISRPVGAEDVMGILDRDLLKGEGRLA